RIDVEEVGREVVGRGEPVRDSVPVDLAVARRERPADAVVGAAQIGPELVHGRLDGGRREPRRRAYDCSAVSQTGNENEESEDEPEPPNHGASFRPLAV